MSTFKNSSSHTFKSRIFNKTSYQVPYMTNSFGKHMSQFNKTVSHTQNSHPKVERPVLKEKNLNRSQSPGSRSKASTCCDSFCNSTQRTSRSSSAPKLLRPPIPTSHSSKPKRIMIPKSMAFHKVLTG